jgi:hypothetical protein
MKSEDARTLASLAACNKLQVRAFSNRHIVYIESRSGADGITGSRKPGIRGFELPRGVLYGAHTGE